MKKIVLMTLLLSGCFVLNCLGQQKITRYCLITPHNSSSEKKFHVDIDLGTVATFPALKDSVLFKKLHASLDHMRSDADMLNYMTSIGWTLDRIVNMAFPYVNYQVYYFKKEFDE